MANEENLKSYKPGQSGNPAGKAPGTRDGLRACLNRALRRNPTGDLLQVLEDAKVDITDPSNAEGLAQVLMNESGKGNMQAAKLIADQTERPLPKEINLTGGGGAPLDLTWNINIVKPKELDE